MSAYAFDETKSKIELGTSALKDITVSTSEPTDEEGNDGDIWLVYTPEPEPEYES